MANYSRQREAIMQVLRSSKAHPNANQVYEEVRKIIPNISLGTVYRNLSSLGDTGEILCLHVANGPERYDGEISPHIHLHCRECGTVYDVPLERDSISDIASNQGFAADKSIYLAYGICKN
ncbi:MAG: transcriptional repressor [Clostridia bacterium]|nr:transcriptional repressor [Clostridia bacterium]